MLQRNLTSSQSNPGKPLMALHTLNNSNSSLKIKTFSICKDLVSNSQPKKSGINLPSCIKNRKKTKEIDNYLLNSREKMGKILKDMSFFQNNLEVERAKMPNLIKSRPVFEKLTYDQYKSQDISLYKNGRTLKVNVTTKNCSLTNSRLEFEKGFANKFRKMKSIVSILAKSNLFMMKNEEGIVEDNQIKVLTNETENNEQIEIVEIEKNSLKKEHIEEKEILKNNSIGKSPKNDFFLKKQSKLLNQEFLSKSNEGFEKKQEEVSKKFKTRLNDILMTSQFFYNVKLNKKKTVIQCLRTHPKLLSTRDKFGNLAIHYAVNRRFYRLTKVIISLGCDLASRNRQEMSLLDSAYQGNDVKMTAVY